MGWLQEHMDNFVVPILGRKPNLSVSDYFLPEEVTIIKNWWRSVKAAAGARPILLPGRDVFLFEVLARREGKPTVFLPNVSRLTAETLRGSYPDYFVFDTGFAGSVPRAMGIENFALASGKNQLFPKLSGSRSLVIKIENSPKYWKRGYTRVSNTGVTEVLQDFAKLDEFERAAAITHQIYTSSAPKFINKQQPIDSGKRKSPPQSVIPWF